MLFLFILDFWKHEISIFLAYFWSFLFSNCSSLCKRTWMTVLTCNYIKSQHWVFLQWFSSKRAPGQLVRLWSHLMPIIPELECTKKKKLFIFNYIKFDFPFYFCPHSYISLMFIIFFFYFFLLKQKNWKKTYNSIHKDMIQRQINYMPTFYFRNVAW